MRLSRFFITRPIFAGVIAVLITIVGLIAWFALPVSQYPDIVPPTVTVSAAYPGASAETVADESPAEAEAFVGDGVDAAGRGFAGRGHHRRRRGRRIGGRAGRQDMDFGRWSERCRGSRPYALEH